MDNLIRKNESVAAARRVAVFLENPDGTPYVDGSNNTITTGVTINYWEPGSSADVDVTSTFVSEKFGRGFVELTQAQCDTVGVGWVSWKNSSSVVIIEESVPVIIRDLDSDRAAAVLDTALGSTHRVSGSLGELAQVIAGQLHVNSLIDNISYGAQAVMTAARERDFDSKTAANAATPGALNNADGEIFRYTISAVDAGSGEISSYKKVRDL